MVSEEDSYTGREPETGMMRERVRDCGDCDSNRNRADKERRYDEREKILQRFPAAEGSNVSANLITFSFAEEIPVASSRIRESF